MKKYILEGKEVVAIEDVLVWGAWFETADRKIARTEVGGLVVSTVFLGLDHAFGGGPPLLFETMVFDGEEEETERYHTYDEAVEGHEKMVEKVRGR